MSTKRRRKPRNRKKEQLFNDTNSSGSEVRCVKNSEEVSDLSVFANIGHKNSSGANNWSKFTEILGQKMAQSPNKACKKNQLKTANMVSEGRANFPTKYHNKIRTTLDTTQNSQSHGHYDSKSHVESGNMVNVSKPFQHKNVTNSTISRHEVPKPILTKHIAMDCEMVGVEMGVNKNMLARISLVNSHGDCIYDKFVKPTEPVLDYRTRVSGVRAKDLENATDFKIVQREVSDMMKGRILIGHALKNDLKVLYLSHPKRSIRDTSRFKKFREGKTPALKKLAKKYLGVVIQEGEHSSVQDALAAMQLYNMFKKEWESSIFSKTIQVKKNIKTLKPSPTQSVEVI